MSTAKFPFPTSASSNAASALPAVRNEAAISAQLAAKKTAVAVAVKKVLTAKPAVKKSVVAKAPVKSSARLAGKTPFKTAAPAARKPLLTKPAAQKTIAKPLLSKTPANTSRDKAIKAEKLEKLVSKLEKAKKPKLVRDSFTIPKAEYVVLDELKQRAEKLMRPAKKSELLRAGIKALAALSDIAFLNALAQVPAIKTGRPSSDK